MSVMSKNHF